MREARRAGIELRQSYVRVGKIALVSQSRYARAKQMRRARREQRRLKVYLGRVMRDIERKASAEQRQRLAAVLEIARRIHTQQRHDRGKLYDAHAPEVECIAKGKAHKPYEFGVKVGVVSTNKESFVLGMQGLPGAPYDGHTLLGSLKQAQRITGVLASEA